MSAPSGYGELAAALSALSSDARLQLLSELRTPKTLREIELRSDALDDGARILARQTVRKHLEKLLDAGIVLAIDTTRSYGPTVEYVLNQQKVFAIAEEFRALARIRPKELLPAPTMQGGEPREDDSIQGPCFVIVKGLDEGRTFDLRPPGPPRGWIVGRKRGLHVALDFDPFVSTENAVIEWDGERHTLRDVRASRNGTTLNFRPLPKDTVVPLRHGDIVGLGRTLLMFHA